MRFSQETHKVKSEPHGIEVDSIDLDNFECELQDMLKIVEKHMESSEEDDKVWEMVHWMLLSVYNTSRPAYTCQSHFFRSGYASTSS